MLLLLNRSKDAACRIADPLGIQRAVLRVTSRPAAAIQSAPVHEELGKECPWAATARHAQAPMAGEHLRHHDGGLVEPR